MCRWVEWQERSGDSSRLERDINRSQWKREQAPSPTPPNKHTELIVIHCNSLGPYLYSSLATCQTSCFRPPFDFLLVPTTGHHSPVWSWQRIAHWLLVGIRRHIHVLRWGQRLPRDASWVIRIHGRWKWGAHLGLANLVLRRRRRRLVWCALLALL